MWNFHADRFCCVWFTLGCYFCFVQAKEYKYYTSREGRQICRADGVKPLQGLLKKLYCTDEKVGKKCENDKFCKSNERCRCHNECEEFRCMKYTPPDVGGEQTLGNCSLACQNNGTCIHTTEGQKCDCPEDADGEFCQVLVEFCDVNICKNNGTCNEAKQRCECTPPYTGRICDLLCPKCPNNTKCQANNYNETKCVCTLKGHEGQNCTDINECIKYPNTCGNGQCHNTIGGHKCICHKGWKGERCETQILYCENVTCLNGGSCVEKNGTYLCICKEGTYGSLCNETRATCQNLKCANQGFCENDDDKGISYCHCRPGFTGPTCATVVQCPKQCLNNGTCLHGTCTCVPGFEGDECERNTDDCKPDPCVNGTCVDQVHNYTCLCRSGFEGRNCDRQILPPTLPPLWKDCNQHCYTVFEDGICNPSCDKVECFYDGGDCKKQKNCSLEEVCIKQFNNSLCDESCNTVECGFDAMDCGDAEYNVPGKLILTLLSTRQEFESKKINFVRKLSSILNSHVIIEDVQENFRNSTRRRYRRDTPQSELNVTMSLKNSGSCKPKCFNSAESAAKYLEAKASRGTLSLPLPVKNIKATKGEDTGGGPGGWGPLWIVLVCTSVPLMLIFSVIVKKFTSTLWAPEGHARHVAGLREPGVGQEGDTNEMTALKRDSGESPILSDSDSPRVFKRFKPDNGLEWLSPMRDNGRMPTLSDSDAWSIPSPVTYEISTETTLHKVARNNKLELATQLISMGADINAKDKNGCSPLHIAISSVSNQIFQLLIRNRQCHIDLQANDGSTPLMVACSTCEYFMVDDLISTGAKVNLIDKQGNTALHCCSRVENSKSAHSLLRNGAKVDAQNVKGETPLFVAAREGSYTCAMVLLQNFANRNIGDNTDKTPLLQAQFYGHKDLVDLLSGCNTPASPMASPSPVSPTYSDIRPKIPGAMVQSVHRFEQTIGSNAKPSKKRKKPRKNAKNSNINMYQQRPKGGELFSIQDCIENFSLQSHPFNSVDMSVDMSFVLNPRFPTPPPSTQMYSPTDIDLRNSSLLLTPSPESLSPDSAASFC